MTASPTDDDRPAPDARLIEVDIPSDVRYIERVVELVRQECQAMCFGPRQCTLNVPVALSEAISNAILRGNAEDPRKHVRVRAYVDPSRLVIEVADEGRGFDFTASMVDPTSDDNIDREDGRGLFLMTKLMDRVERYEDEGANVVRLTLLRAS